MLNHLLAIRTSLTLTIIVMGLVAIILVSVTGTVYRQLTLDNQKSAISDLVRLGTDRLMQDLQQNAQNLGLSLQRDTIFRALIKENNIEGMRAKMNNMFHQYFVTVGIIKLEKLYLLDLDFNVRAASTEGSLGIREDMLLCPDLSKRAKLRKGSDRLTTISGLCVYNNRPYHAVIVPAGGLRIKGYIQVVTDPSHVLTALESTLGLPIQIRYHDGGLAYQSNKWPDSKHVLDTSIVAEYSQKGLEKNTILHIYALRDLKKLSSELNRKRNLVILISVITTILTSFLAIFILRKTTLNPMQALQTQVRKIRHDKNILGEQIIVKGSPEIKELATGFNEMTSALRNAQDELEDRVLKRTASLHETNVKLQDEIKERKQVEQALTLAKEEAEQANKAKSQFLARMSHELRTPLNGILGFAQLLDEEPTTSNSEAYSESVKHILKSGWHLLELVNEVLDLSRIESGKMSVQMEAVRLNPLVKECISVISPIALERNIVITDAFSPEQQYIVRADQTRLKQVLLNLLSNAVKYNFENGKVYIYCETLPQGRLRIFVQDSGPGITEEGKQIIFDPFTRLSDAEHRQIGGTGIGLSISKQLVEMMDGQLGLESQHGAGSKFWIELQQAVISTDKIKVSQNISAVDTTSVHQYKRTLLYIEDDPTNLNLVKNILAQYLPNLILLDAHTAELGVQIARTRHPDMILMDINLPGMNGDEALKLLKSQDKTRDIPVVAISADAMPADIDRALSIGFDSYVTKPVNVEELLGKINEIFDKDTSVTYAL